MANPNTAQKGEKGDVGLCGRIAEGKASIGKSTAATTATLCVKGVNIFTKYSDDFPTVNGDFLRESTQMVKEK